MSLSSLARHYLDWERPDITIDDARGSTRTWAAVKTRMACLVQPLSARERALYGQRAVVFSHKIYFDKVLDIHRGDRFYDPATTKIYVVVGWFNQAGQDRVFCVEAQEQAS